MPEENDDRNIDENSEKISPTLMLRLKEVEAQAAREHAPAISARKLLMWAGITIIPILILIALWFLAKNIK